MCLQNVYVELLWNYFKCNIQHSIAATNYIPGNCLVLHLAEFPVCMAEQKGQILQFNRKHGFGNEEQLEEIWTKKISSMFRHCRW